ncbi:MAG: hypothetical protein ACETVW_06365 [Dehalococcoidia bacterium]
MDWALLIPILSVALGIACGGWAIYWEHKKDVALIEKGLYQPKQPKPLGPPGWEFLLAGSVVTGIGIALIISAFVFQQGNRHPRTCLPIYLGCVNSSLFYYQREKSDFQK